jgi:HK97 family phage portal protein
MIKGIKDIFKKKNIGYVPFFGLMMRPAPSRITKPDTFYERSVFFNKALDKRASVIAGIEFISYIGEKEDIQTNKILRNPSSFLSGYDFWYLVQLYYDIYGAYYIWIERTGQKIKELHLLDPTDIESKFDKSGFLDRFESKKTSQVYYPEEIMWEYRPDINDIRKPKSILNEGAKETLRTEIELREYQRKIAQSGGRNNLLFSFKTQEGLTKEQQEKLKASWRKQISEARNSEEGQMPFFLGADTQVHNLERSPKEIGYLESQKAVMEEVSTITGVPKTILSSFEDIKFSNAEEARKTFLSETIYPIILKRASEIERSIAKGRVETEDIIPENIDEKTKIVETGHKTNTLTPNERRELLGYEPIEGGDKIDESSTTRFQPEA